MTIQKSAEFMNRAIHPLVRVITFVAGCGLMTMMILTAVDVILRFFNHPLPGAYELIEYLMALTVAFSVTVCAHHRGHITVDIVTQKLKKNAEKALAALTTLIAVGYTVVIMWQSTLQIQEVYSSNMTSSVLKVAVYPFTAIVAISFIFTTIVFIVDVFNLLAEIKK